jgi:hypothetical protein
VAASTAEGNTVRHYVAAAAIALLLTGCSTSQQDDDGGAEQPGSTTPAGSESDTGGESDASGYVSLKLGDTAELSVNTDGSEPATWTIEKIEIDPSSCEGPGDSGHLLLLHVRADTGPDGNAAEQIPSAFRAESFAEPGQSGEPSPASPWGCQSTEPGNQPLPVPYQRNQELIGTVGLVVPEANGTLIQTNPLTSSEGWQWSYPAN